MTPLLRTVAAGATRSKRPPIFAPSIMPISAGTVMSGSTAPWCR